MPSPSAVRRVDRRIRPRASLLLPVLLVLAACGGESSASLGSIGAPSASPPPSPGPVASAEPTAPPPATGTITLYASIQQPVVDAVLAEFAAAEPEVTVELFRAPTGELSARIAAELRDGRVGGDVLWLSDPLSMQSWAAQGVLQSWSPANVAGLNPADGTESFWGTRILNMVTVRGVDVSPGPADWADLADPAYRDGVALPDPGFAGSAFGALGFFGLHPDYGFEFYEALKANGAVQVRSPDEVTTGVAEGRFKAGMTLDTSARAAVDKGSPVALVWPSSGAIAMYSPVGVIAGTDNEAAARAFVEFLLSERGQEVLGSAGQEPVRPGSGGPEPGGPQARPDWPAVFGQQEDLLERYRATFGG